ncbi:MAG: oligoendopeptidase F [Firmicutes bacterium]|nr:oligoendopeptidase F [Bacillota bacterium]
MGSLPNRKDTDPKYHWHLEDIFADLNEWEETFKYVEKQLPEVAKLKGTLGTSADTLYHGLSMVDEISLIFYKTYAYARMRTDEDTTNSEAQARSDRAKNLLVKLQAEIAFFEPEVLSISKETIKEFMDLKPELRMYEHFFEDLWRQKEHVLSPSEEQILAQAGQLTSAPHSIYGMLNNADLTFPEITDESGNKVAITHGRFIPFLQSRDRRVRKEAFEGLYGTYDKIKHASTALLAAQVNANIFKTRARKFNSAREAALSRDNIPESVYDSLIEAVHDKLPAMHRYVSLRKKMLNLDEIHMYDVYVPMVDDVDMKYTFEEAKKVVAEGLKPLGEDYLKNLVNGMENGWLDVYENKGKRSGAYSNSVYGIHPYVLLNHQDDLNSMFTIAHEMGHAMHSYYTDTTQPFVYSSYSIFVAEVASTVNESLLLQYLLGKVKTKKERMYLLNHYLEEFKGTVFRQTMFAEFEKIIHSYVESGQALTVDYLNSTYKDLNKKYFGPEMVVDDLISLEWARIPHFFLNFYVFQYATGYSSAVALALDILQNGKEAVERYLDFLKAGSSEYPIEILAHAGVDMRTPEPIVKALDVFEQTLDELEKLTLEN